MPRPLSLLLVGAALLLGLGDPAPAQAITRDNFVQAAIYSRNHAGLGLRVQQGGRVVFEDYAPGESSDTWHKIYSGTKNFVAIAALYAEQEGLLDLNEPASKTLTEWRHDRRSSITLDQLLSQTSGLSPGTDIINDASDQMAAAVRVHLIDPPGTRFHYGPEGYQAFGEILKRKLRPTGRSVEGYLKSRIFGPLHIDIPYWAHDNAGNPLMHAGLGLTYEDWAKFGEFQKDEAENQQKQSIRYQLFKRLFIGHHANPAYGLSFWLNHPPPNPRLQKMRDLQPAMDGEQLYPGGPADLYAIEGTAKQRLYIIPSRDLVVCTLRRRRFLL